MYEGPDLSVGISGQDVGIDSSDGFPAENYLTNELV